MVSFSDHGVIEGRSTSAQATCGHLLPAAVRSAGTTGLAFLMRILPAVILTSVIAGPLAHAQSVSCTCRYKGEKYGVGESICLKSPQGLRMATCEMVLNNTSWQFSDAPCPLTQLQQTDSSAPEATGNPDLRQTHRQDPVIEPASI